MARETLTLPKLPPGKRVEQILAMRDLDFAEVANNAGFSSADLRELLEKILARSTDTGQAAAETVAEKRKKKKKSRQEKKPQVFSEAAAVFLALKPIFWGDVPSGEEEERVAFEVAEAEVRNHTDTGSRAESKEAVDLYTTAHRIRAKRQIAAHKESEPKLSGARARERVKIELDRKFYGINLAEEKKAVGIISRELSVMGTYSNVGGLFDALQEGKRTPDIEAIFSYIAATARESILKRKFSRDPIVNLVIEVFKKNGILSQGASRYTAAIGAMELGEGGGDGYYRGGRPRRDMHGASGGEDDK